MTDTAAQPKLTPTFLKVRDALTAALERGWVVVPKAPGIALVRWAEEKPTPAYVSKSQWPGETYPESTFVSFVYRDGRVSSAIVDVETKPWMGGRDHRVSVKAALEILASH